MGVARVHGARAAVANPRRNRGCGRVVGEWPAIVAVRIVPVRHGGEVRQQGEGERWRKQ